MRSGEACESSVAITVMCREKGAAKMASEEDHWLHKAHRRAKEQPRAVGRPERRRRSSAFQPSDAIGEVHCPKREAEKPVGSWALGGALTGAAPGQAVTAVKRRSPCSHFLEILTCTK